MYCTLRHRNEPDEEGIAQHLRFNSVKEMRGWLEGRELPGWLIGAEANSGKNRTRGKSTPRLRDFSPGKELPSAGNATELFRERLEV